MALTDLKAGEVVEVAGKNITISEDVSAKHKFASVALQAGDEIVQYGVLVGAALSPIPEGGRMTTENIEHRAQTPGPREFSGEWDGPDVKPWQDRHFMGFHRANGRVGTANHWLVIPLVFCENRNIDTIAQAMCEELGFAPANPYRGLVQQLDALHEKGADVDELQSLDLSEVVASGKERRFPNVSGLKFLNHAGGCGGASSDSVTLVKLLAGYITHPNVAGATVLSLGCQKAQIDMLKAEIEKRSPGDPRSVFFFEQQAMSSERELVSEAIKATFTGLVQANRLERQPSPLSALTIGMECGGSDGFSGISANPLLGVISDRLAALGGTPVLSEFPELCGVEQNLVNRCDSDSIANRFRKIIGAYGDRADALGEGFSNNPSPGNVRDGLITDAIKSAGAARKGGTSNVKDVLDYTEPFTKPGLNLLCTPGNDVESTTALAGSGANLILFTTGLGTPTGNPVTPVIKISSNQALAQRLPDIIDFDAGSIISGEKGLEDLADDLLDLILRVASGESTCAMKLGQDDFLPWKRGLSL